MPNQITFKSFEGQSFLIGIDVHRKSWKVTILNKDYELKYFNQNANALAPSHSVHPHFHQILIQTRRRLIEP